MKGNDWTDRQIRILVEGRQGKVKVPFKALAERLGVSKDAAVGKYHRLFPNLVRNTTPRKGTSKAVTGKGVSTIQKLAPPPPALPAKRLDKVLECSWITSTGRDAQYCNAPTLAGKSYCAEHHALAVRRPFAFEKRLLQDAQSFR